MEQQLRDAQYALAAADCAQLALMLANERLRALCYADTLAALRDEQTAVTARGQERQGAQGASGDEAGSIAAAIERVSALLPAWRACMRPFLPFLTCRFRLWEGSSLCITHSCDSLCSLPL